MDLFREYFAELEHGRFLSVRSERITTLFSVRVVWRVAALCLEREGSDGNVRR